MNGEQLHNTINTILWIILAAAVLILYLNGHFNVIQITQNCTQPIPTFAEITRNITNITIP